MKTKQGKQVGVISHATVVLVDWASLTAAGKNKTPAPPLARATVNCLLSVHWWVIVSFDLHENNLWICILSLNMISRPSLLLYNMSLILYCGVLSTLHPHMQLDYIPSQLIQCWGTKPGEHSWRSLVLVYPSTTIVVLGQHVHTYFCTLK